MQPRTALVTVAVLASLLACSPLGNLGGLVGGGEGVAVSQLWSDVPAYPGAQRADVELPLVMRLGIEAASKAIMSQAGDAGGNLEFVAYTTGDSPDQVIAFYNNQRMAGEGWETEEGMGCAEAGAEGQDFGAMCAFGRQGGQRDSALFIVAGAGDEAGTSIFYVRIDADPGALATAAAQ